MKDPETRNQVPEPLLSLEAPHPHPAVCSLCPKPPRPAGVPAVTEWLAESRVDLGHPLGASGRREPAGGGGAASTICTW